MNPLVFLIAWLALLAVVFALGGLRARGTRKAAAAVTLVVLVSTLPWNGVDFAVLKRANLFVAGALAVWLLLRCLKVPAALEARLDRRVLLTLAVVSGVLYFNFFSFHGEHTFVHYHDVAHYYLGSKYFPELGYGRLYDAMLRAEADVYGGPSVAAARDLSTGEVVPAAALLARGDAVRRRFTVDRWIDFKRDVALFREALGPNYHEVLEDHGFNPTPVWAVLGGALANRVGAGSRTGIVALSLLDPLLLLVAFAVARWAFGLRAALLAFIHYCLIFGASFGWTGGAFLRSLWFVSAMVAVGLLEREMAPVAAGALLGLAAMLRVFPALFLVGPLVRAVARTRAEGRVPRFHVKLFAGAAVAAVVLGAVTLRLPEPVRAWSEFRENLSAHMNVVSPNVVGLSHAVAMAGSPDQPAEAVAARKRLWHRVQLVVVFLPALAAAFVLAPRMGEAEAMALGVPLALAGLNLASYYWVMLALLTLVYREQPRRLLALVAVELGTYALYLFETREALLYAERSLILAAALAAVYARPSVRDLHPR